MEVSEDEQTEAIKNSPMEDIVRVWLREEELCRLIKKKLEKGKNIAQIADECEETEERILELMEKMEKTSYNE